MPLSGKFFWVREIFSRVDWMQINWVKVMAWPSLDGLTSPLLFDLTSSTSFLQVTSSVSIFFLSYTSVFIFFLWLFFRLFIFILFFFLCLFLLALSSFFYFYLFCLSFLVLFLLNWSFVDISVYKMFISDFSDSLLRFVLDLPFYICLFFILFLCTLCIFLLSRNMPVTSVFISLVCWSVVLLISSTFLRLCLVAGLFWEPFHLSATH